MVDGAHWVSRLRGVSFISVQFMESVPVVCISDFEDTVKHNESNCC